MAEQNRKTTDEKVMRQDAQKVVDDYLDYLFSDRDSDSVAREGRSLLGIYSEHGSIPRGSGFSGFCKLAAKVDRIRYRQVSARMRVARDLMLQLDDKYIDALCVDRCYRGRTKVATDPFTQERIEIEWNDGRCASLLYISSETLRKRISRGYQALETVLQSHRQAA